MTVPCPTSNDPSILARDEAWWANVAELYPRSPDAIVNLEHGYFGAMAEPVLKANEEGIRYVNERLSPFIRGEFTQKTLDDTRQQVATLINAERDEILLTRSGTESMLVLITQYRGLKPGDAVLWCNLDYHAMRDGMKWLEQRYDVQAIELQFDLPITREALIARYAAALRDTPNLKMMLLSHVFACNGQATPVQEIVALARSHGVEVLVDCAHALGQLPVDVQEMQLDFAGFNLHKWIGAPVGLGFTYIRKSHLQKIEPHFGMSDFPESDIRCRLNAGMPLIGGILALPKALDFHCTLGGMPVKRARIAKLRSYWVDKAKDLPGFRLYSPAEGEDGTALVSFGMDGFSAKELQKVLFQRFSIFTVERSIGHLNIVRATVAITTRLDELDQFVAALTTLSQEVVNKA